jgi:hypothetical protein
MKHSETEPQKMPEILEIQGTQKDPANPVPPDAQPGKTMSVGSELPGGAPATPGTTADERPENGPTRTVSARKIAANRANAAHSTGPRTPEGKDNSRFNAVKHGLTANFFLNLIEQGTAESKQMEDMQARMFEHYQPVGAVEELLVEKIVIESLRYGRLLTKEQNPKLREVGYYPYVLTVDKSVRYETALNRRLFQAIGELERQQAARKALASHKVGEQEEGE